MGRSTSPGGPGKGVERRRGVNRGNLRAASPSTTRAPEHTSAVPQQPCPPDIRGCLHHGQYEHSRPAPAPGSRLPLPDPKLKRQRETAPGTQTPPAPGKSAAASLPRLADLPHQGIAFSNGERWKVLRRFSVQILRNFGMGKRSIEERILEEGGFLLEELRKTEGEPFNPLFMLSRSVSNIICSVIFGKRFDYDDERLLTIIHVINDNFQIMSSPWGEMYNLFPSLLDWVPGPHQRIFQNFGNLRDLISGSVREHQATLDPNSPRDFIDCFLTKIAQEKENPLSHFHMDTLLMTTQNLIFGGTETVGTTLRHAFLALMKYPKIQARVQEEIDRVVGRSRLPTLEDRAAMPYTDAVIHEVQRFADVIPMNLPHRVIRDTAFRGFLIPEGTDIITLLNTVHYDPSQFLKPQEFNPEHFLDANQSFKKSPAFMPFSAGRRLCLGESLARMELFLYLTAILQSFSLQPLGKPEDIDLTPLGSGLGNLPRPFQLRLLER
ncbi:cytochrome P450 2F5, transcript variant X2 [Ictidomys tridecemlineatus]|uniref:cytochrome P450 2F5 isoform X1 n=1 Tax=Ictidomys tridecemlineatus TaxID=43179 RepID=UPI000682A2E2|nr:cytochrome P450 2F5 isoform X1 [Ictidomys tridecemlineatus]KAG3256086.1 cytochrome P450 2F5, transcript variant X2 [Ictidomys tridecemlineatus]